MKQKLESVHTKIDDIGAIFITHEHADHIKGLKTYLKRHQIPIYLSEGSYNAIVNEKRIGEDYHNFHIIREDQRIEFFDFHLQPFLVSHDAYEPFGYQVF